MNITKKQAIRIIDNATDKEDPYWTDLVYAALDLSDSDIDYPSIFDVLAALGVTRAEYDGATQ